MQDTVEASAKGNSAKCTEMTSVILESALHKMQNLLQDLLPLTPRPPIEGEPNRCKQEVVDSVVMAGRTNRTVKLAEPTKTDADVDRTALLGGELVEMACGVDEGDQTERESKSWLQQTKLLCGEIVQHSGNTTENIPIAHGMPLEGEWTCCASGEASNPKLDGIESEGCASGMNEQTCTDEADSSAGHGTEPAGSSNESEMLVTALILSEGPDGSNIPHVCLGGTQMQTDDMNSLGSQSDASNGQVDVLRMQTGQADSSNVSKNAEMANISHADGAGTYLAIRHAKRPIHETDGTRIHADTSIWHGDIPSVETDTLTAENETPNIRRC